MLDVSIGVLVVDADGSEVATQRFSGKLQTENEWGLTGSKSGPGS